MLESAFYQWHLLLDKHAVEQIKLIDQIAERVQTLGGIAVGDPRHIAEITRIPRPPNGCEEVPAMLSRLLEAHEIILNDAHEAALRTADLGDDGTNDLIVSDVIRSNELQAWGLVEHLVDRPLGRSNALSRHVKWDLPRRCRRIVKQRPLDVICLNSAWRSRNWYLKL